MGADEDVGSLWASEAQHYREVAKDAQTESSDLEQAANLYVAADGCLQTGDTAKALAKAKQALPLFRGTEVEQGVADTIRLLVHVHCLRDERKEASKTVLEELNRSGPRDQRPRAGLFLASAEVNSDGRGNKKREEALQATKEALAIFRELKDKEGVAKALLAQVAVHAKRKCSNEEKAADMLQLTREAQPIFRGLGDKRGEGQTLHFVGVAFDLKQMFQDAVRATSEARDLFRLAGESFLEAHEAHLLALLSLKEQDAARAVTAADAALRLLKGFGPQGPREAEVTRTLVQAHIANGDGQQALTVAQSCLMRAQIMLDKKMEVEALLLVSHAYMNLQPSQEVTVQPCPLEALESAERALALAKEMKVEELEAKIMALLAKLHALRQDFEEASEAARLAERVSAKDLEAEGAEMQAVATAHLNKGELQAALQKAQEAKSFFSGQKYPQGEASSLLLLSQVHFEQGQVDTAVSETKEAQVIYQDIDDKKGIGEALMQIAEFRNANKEHARALHAADRARVHVQRHGDKVMESRMTLLAAQNRTFLLVRKHEEAEAEQRKASYAFAASWEEVAKATAAARSAVKLSEELSDSAGVGSAMTVVAQMYVFTQRFEHALAAAEEAVLRFVEVGDVRSEAAVLVLQAQIHLALGSLKKSLSLARQGHLLFREAGDAQGEAIARGVLAGLRRFEFVVDERAGVAALPPSAVEEEDQLAVSAGPAAKVLDAGFVAEQIQSVTRRMVGAGEETIIAADNPLMDIGITSMNAVLFRNKLGQEFEGVDLPVTLVFDFPTIRDLTSLVVDRARE